jgi:hypothetical protein
MIILMLVVVRNTNAVVQVPATPEAALTAQAAFKEVLRAPLFYLVIVGFVISNWCKNG